LAGFEGISNKMARSIGMNGMPWYSCTLLVTYIYMFFSICVLFYRPDFINLTVVTAALFMLYNPDRIKKWTFRMLVLGIFMTIIYDLVFFFFMDYSVADTGDGGLEKSVKSFSRMMSIISFFFRVSYFKFEFEDHCGACLLERLDRLHDHQAAER